MTTARTITIWVPEPGWAEAMGGLPGGMVADVWTGGEQLPDSVGEVEVVVFPFGVPDARLPVLAKLPKLQLIQLLSAGAERVIPMSRPESPCATRGARTIPRSRSGSWP